MNSNDLFSNKPLNILKAALPYIPVTMQKIISYYIKIEEFNIMRSNFNTTTDNIISACDYDNTNAQSNPVELINAVKPYLNNDEKNLIDMFMNMVTAFNMYNTYKSINLPAIRNENAKHNSNNISDDFNEYVNENEFSNNTVINSDVKSLNNITEDKITENTTSINQTSQNGPDIEALKNMLSPSQRAMFDTYSSLLNKTL